MIKVCLDAGHYGKYNQSPANRNYYEAEAMWKLHLLQKKYLEQYGIEVVLTRSEQATDRNLYDRGAASKGCKLFISDHSNAVGSSVNESVDYPVAYVCLNGKADDIGLRLTECIKDVIGTKQDGRITTKKNSTGGEYYGVIRGAVAVGTPAMILEHSFHTNTKCTNWLLDESNLDKLAKAEAEVIAEWLALEREDVDLLNGFVTVTYKGEDGLNVRSEPKMGENVKEIVYGGTYAVVGISADKDWYKLKSGGYITANKKYVKFSATKPTVESYMVKIDVSAIYDKNLNVRERPDGSSKIMDTIKEDMSLTIVDEENDSNGKKWGLLKAYEDKRNGWIRLDYAKRV